MENTPEIAEVETVEHTEDQSTSFKVAVSALKYKGKYHKKGEVIEVSDEDAEDFLSRGFIVL